MDRSARKGTGIDYTLVSSALFGASTRFAKLLNNTPPQLMAGLLYLGAGIGLGAVWIAREFPSLRDAIHNP